MTRARILVVDDEPAILRTVERVLGDHYHVTGARSAAEALALLPELEPDLAIVDVRMPEIDGFELTGRLKAASPDLDVILMTGSINELDGQLIRAIREKAFYFIQKPFDREVLQTLVARCLELRALEQENRGHLARLERELTSARTFQRSLLPPDDGRIGRIAVSARCLSCTEMGGDIFDYAACGPGRTAVLVADVSGHGVSAAMLTGIVKSAFRAAAAEEFAPIAVVERIWSGLRPFGYERFVTAFCARVSEKGPRLEYVNAGHPSGILWGRSREAALLASTGPLISPAWDEPRWEMQTVGLSLDDRLLLYTDGIVETHGEAGLFGAERILALVRREPAGGAALLEAILRAQREFSAGRPLQDDMTLLTVGFERA